MGGAALRPQTAPQPLRLCTAASLISFLRTPIHPSEPISNDPPSPWNSGCPLCFLSFPKRPVPGQGRAGVGQGRGADSPLHLFLVALTPEALQILLATLLLCLALLFKDLDGLVEGLDCCALHLQLLTWRGGGGGGVERLLAPAGIPFKSLMRGEGRSPL